VGTRRWRWDRWLVAGPVSGALVFGLLAPLLFLVDARVNGLPPGLSYDPAAAAIAALGAAVLGTLAGVVAGIVCAVITVPIEWFGRPTRRFYTWLAVGVTAMLGSLFGALGHGANGGLALVLFPIVPVCVSTFAAYWVGAWVWSRG
jgi:hypothetical protein